ncbi:hypothetical protein ACIOWI_36335 [Streptomyces sp. NPDC087659]
MVTMSCRTSLPAPLLVGEVLLGEMVGDLTVTGPNLDAFEEIPR